MKLRQELESFGIDLMRSIPKAPTCYLNFDLNFKKFPNWEVGELKLRYLITGVEARVVPRVGLKFAMFETPCCSRVLPNIVDHCI
jgi:hypothetical protein